ncbi:two-partner secretion domain-containing protein [Paraburkholderia acidipaludis]|nr:hemagglutinin repeat-containing protein [Paraburkholderia acidipaludis]
MNSRCYRLVFSKLRGMLVAVSETAIAQGKSGQDENGPSVARRSFTLFAMRHVAFAALAVFGLAPLMAGAQIVPSGAHAPNVINTANGLPQVNVQKPSGAGVSLNTYSQFDVGSGGAILNNSPTNTNTRLAGQISGNPNLSPGQSAKIIVNQVNSNNPSRLAGYVEVAGQKADVVIANSSGLVVDGGGFINTARGILTTGNPLIDGSGNLNGFSVTQGTITVQGAGLNASNIDEVDLLARAVELNDAAVYANRLNVTTGANSIDYASLTPTPIAGSGPAPGVSLDVSQLGGMYANSIILVGTENGVGVANAGTIAAQAGDLTLTSAGQLVQSGRMNASGNTTINAASIQNTGTVYSQQNTSLSTPGALVNSATIAAQQNTSVNAGSVASTGVFGAGINGDGTTGPSGNLLISAAGLLSANGQNVAAGMITLYGVALDLSNAQTGAGTALALTATGGNLSLVNATTGAGTSITANAAGTFDNSGGKLSSGTSTQIVAGAVTNAAGQMTAGTTLGIVTGGAFDNTGGIAQAQGQESISAGSVDNTAGKLLSLNGDGLTLSATGQLVNGAGGDIGGNGAVSLQGGTVVNQGDVTAQTSLQVSAQSVDNSGGAMEAGQNATLNAGSQFKNASGNVSAQAATISATTLDNSSGSTQAAQLTLNATNFVNHAGTVTQTGTGPMAVNVSGLFDNSAGGTFQTNSTDLALSPATIDNDGGSILHAGTGTFTLDPGNGSGSVSDVNGRMVSNGQVVLQAGSLNNTSGDIEGKAGLAANVSGEANNTDGKLLSGAGLGLASGTFVNDGGTTSANTSATITTGSLSNRNGGSIEAPDLTLDVSGTADNNGGSVAANQLQVSATDLINEGGTVTQYGTGPMAFNVTNLFDNSAGGTFQTNSTNFTLSPASVDNDGGSILHAGTGLFTLDPGNGSGSFSNVGGKVISAGTINAQMGAFNNGSGTFAAQQGMTVAVLNGINNTAGLMRSFGSLDLTTGGALTNVGGSVQAGTSTADAPTLSVQATSIDNTQGVVSNLGTGNTSIQGGSQIVNAAGVVTGNGAVSMGASDIQNTQGGQVSGASLGVQAGDIDNTSSQMGTLPGSQGDAVITATGTITNTNGQMGATHDLTLSASTLSGGGIYSASNDVSVNLQGDFTTTPDQQFDAGHNLTFTLPGTFTNGAIVEAANNLGVNAGDIVNSGAMMAGGTLETHSSTLTNTGAMVGGSVSLNATSTLSNSGPSALIGASDSSGTLELLAPDIENVDNVTATDTQATTAIFGLGSVVLAGGKNADGSYTNANLIDNVSALIQSSADMALYANQVTNTRRVMTTSGSYSVALDASSSIIQQLGISLSGCTATYMAACGPGNPQVMGSTGDPSMIGGVPTDPPHGGQWNSTYQYTTYTGVALANLITAISPQSQIISGGNLNASSVGLFQNYWSAVAAVGNIAMPATLDQNSWQGQLAPGVQVTYSGEYHYDNYDNSEYNWQLPFGNAGFVTPNPGGYNQAAPADIRTYALPSYESSFVAGGTITGTGVNIDNTAGNAGIPSMNLAPGTSLAVGIGTLSGAAGGTSAGTGPVKGGGGTVDPAIASATAQNVLDNLTIPQGGLFHLDTTPGAPYLIETNPAFTSTNSFLSSNYYLNLLGYNPQTTEKRLGDGLYEQQLVQNQITSLTGKAVLGPYTNTQSMYEALMASGASLAQSLNLPLGMGLSAAQVAALTSNVIIMQTEVVDGQSVLVPVVYLAQASQQNVQGPLIGATDIDLQNAQTFTNSGTVQAGNTLSISGQQISDAFGALKSGGLMSLNTTGDIDFTSANVSAGSLALNTGGNLILNTATNTLNQVSATGATRVNTTLGPIANLDVAGNASIVTGGNFGQNGSNLNVGGNLGMAVGGNWDIGTVQTGEHKVVERANGVSNTDINSATGSTMNVGGVSEIGVENNLTATGANINLAGGGVLAAKGDATFQAATTTSTVDSNDSGSDSHGSYAQTSHVSSQTLTGTTLNAGNSLTVASGNNINVTGSTINLAQGTATLAAANDVNIGAATATQVDNSQEQHSHSNMVSGMQEASSRDTTITQSQGSTVSADALSISSGHDINVTGSTVVGTNNVALSAANNVNITTSQDTMQSSGSQKETHTGLGTSGLSVTVGTNKLATTDQESSVTNNASMVGSLDGSVSVSAGNNLTVTGSDLIAAKNITGTAANVTINSATNTGNTSQSQQTGSSGLAIGLGGSVGDAINGAYQQGQSLASGSSNGRADALHAIAAGGDAALASYGAYQMATTGVSQAAGAPSIGVQVSVGSSHSQSQSSENQTTQVGSNVQAGGTTTFVATGNGTAGSGNVTIAGSNVSASDVVLAAANQVNIVNTTNTDSTRSSNSSSGASVGVSLTTNGFGVSASMQNAHGDANSDAATQNASHVTGTNSVTILSGGDTNITGSQVAGNQVTAAVGGNLNIASVQDTTTSAAHQSSAGGGFSISEAGGSISGSAQNGHADGNYAQVNEQAGIAAGSGGFDIGVKGNTGLTGAVISSTSDASRNSLTTGTLTYSDIQNQSHYDATSNGISAGAGFGNTGTAIGPGSVSGTGSIAPMMSQDANGDQSATTRSAISAGTINVTNPGAQTQDVANLSRDTTNTNGTVANTPDVNTLLNQQADTMQAAQAAGQVVAQGIGAYANSKEQAAKDAGDSATADAWAEGGTDRVLAHIAGGALIGGLGGGGFGTAAAGAAGAGVSSALAGKLNSVADSIGGATGSMTVGNTVSNVLAGLSGALVGGSAGAFTASNADLYNRNQTNANGTGGTGSQALDKVEQYASEFGQAALDLVPGHKMADQAQTAFALGNYGMGVALAIGSIGDAAMGVLTGGESDAISSAVGRATSEIATADGATNVTNGLNLNKSLASQQQLSELTGAVTTVAGNGSNTTLRDAPRLVAEYGGNPSDWSKVTSSSYTAADGTQYEIHAYKNAVTGEIVEPKTIVTGK